MPASIISNIFPVKYNGTKIYMTGVSVKSGTCTLTQRGLVGLVVRELLKEKDRTQWLFNGTQIVSLFALPEGPLMVTSKEREYEVSFISHDVVSPRTDEEKLLMALNNVLRHALGFTRYELSMGKYLVKELEVKDERMTRKLSTTTIFRCFTAAIGIGAKKPDGDTLFLVHEVSHKIKNNTPISELPRNVLERKVKENAQFAGFYDNTRSYNLAAVVPKRMSDPLDGDKGVTFREYYLKKFQSKDTDVYKKCLEIVKALPDSIDMLKACKVGPGGDVFLIPQLCSFIKLDDNIKSVLPRVCGARPRERAQFALSMHEHFSNKREGSRYSALDVLRMWGITIMPTPIQPSHTNLSDVAINVMGDPRTTVLRDRTDIRAVLKSAHGVFSAPTGYEKITPLIIFEKFSERMMNDFVAPLNDAFRKWRMNVDLSTAKRLNIDTRNRNAGNIIDKETAGVNLALVFVGGSRSFLYNTCKKVLLKKGIVSQAVNCEKQNGDNLRGQRAMICNSLVVQIMAKMGCPVWLPTPFGSTAPTSPINNGKLDLLVLSMDVYHAGRVFHEGEEAQDDSIAGFCGMWFVSVPGKPMPAYKSWGMVARHAARQEISYAEGKCTRPDAAKSAYMKFLEDILYEEKRIPSALVVIRDGTSISQLKLLATHELKQVKDVLQKHGKGKPCNLTFCVCVKRINQMFVSSPVPANRLDMGRLNGVNFDNAPAGLVIADERIVGDPKKEFFMFSLGTSPSTARAVHYMCVELGMDIKDLQELCFKMSHMFYTWPGTILVPAPVQYSHTAANLAAEVFEKGDKNITKTHHGLLFL